MAQDWFCPFDKLKAILGLEGSAISSYSQLDTIRDSVQAAFENYMVRYIELDDYTDAFFQQSATRFIYLKAWPIETVTSLTIDGVAVTDYTEMDNALLLSSAVNMVPVIVSWSGGWESDTYPADIERAALLQVAYELGGIDNIGASSVTTEGGTVNRPELGLLTEVKRLLQPYRSPTAYGFA